MPRRVSVDSGSDIGTPHHVTFQYYTCTLLSFIRYIKAQSHATGRKETTSLTTML